MDGFFNLHALEFFRGIPLFSDLDDSEVQELLREMEAVYFEPGHRIYSEGDQADGLFVIERGEVSVTVQTGNRPLLLAHLGNGSVIGEMSLLSGEQRSASVSALTLAQGYRLSSERFQTLRKSGAALAHKIVLQLVRTLDERRKHLEEQIQELRSHPQVGAHLLKQETKELIARVRKG